MLKKLFFYPIICVLIYNNIIRYLENKRKFKELFDSLEIVNIRIENINKLINRKKVMFEITKDNTLDVNDNTYSSDKSSMGSSDLN
tara:strand:+ start:5818 stop:6075 length:258 start_codon:yes stop_codon:yes gene_type:complete